MLTAIPVAAAMEQAADDKRADTGSLQDTVTVVTVNEEEHLADRTGDASQASSEATSESAFEPAFDAASKKDASEDIADNGAIVKVYRQTTINLVVAALADADADAGQWRREWEFDVNITDDSLAVFADDPDAHDAHWQRSFFNVLERAVLPAGEIINGTVHFYLEHAKRNIEPSGEVFDAFDVHTEGNIYVRAASPAVSNRISAPYYADIDFPAESYRAFINITDLLTEVHHEK